MSVLASVEETLGDDRSSWRAQTALALAKQVDENGSASAARELRAVMDAIEAGTPVEVGDAVDEVRRRREARRAAGGSAAT